MISIGKNVAQKSACGMQKSIYVIGWVCMGYCKKSRRFSSRTRFYANTQFNMQTYHQIWKYLSGCSTPSHKSQNNELSK